MTPKEKFFVHVLTVFKEGEVIDKTHNQRKREHQLHEYDMKHGTYQIVNPWVHESRVCSDMHMRIHPTQAQIWVTRGQEITIVFWSYIATFLPKHTPQPQLYFHLWDRSQELSQVSKVLQSLMAKGKVCGRGVHLYNEQ